jgi:hypothetical protein
MQPAQRALVVYRKPRNTALKRGILFTVLTIFCVICFWYALSGVNSPPCPLSVDPGNNGSACGTGSSGSARPSGLGAILSGQASNKRTPTTGNSRVAVGPQKDSGSNNRGGGGGRSIGPAGSGNIASVSASNSAIASAGAAGGSSNPLACRSQCQTTGLTCQTACSRQYNVTNQTQNWSTCMQTCSSKISVCANSCLSGLKPPSNAQVPVASGSAQASGASQSGTGLRSKPTPSLPIQMPDSSSSSSQ